MESETPHFSVTEIRNEHIELIVNYWLESDPIFLESMGVDLTKIPEKKEWIKMLDEQLAKPYRQKQFYYIIWLLNGAAVGHSNVNKIFFGEEAYMHLHLWNGASRQKGVGAAFVKLTIPYFFKNLQLKNLYCEPYALNPAPNKTLEKVGFQFIKEYITTPGYLNFEQPVKQWCLSANDFSSW